MTQIDDLTASKFMRLNHQWPQWRHECNDTERQFIADLLTRWRKYGPFLHLTVKQINWFTTIYDRLDRGQA